MVLKQYFAISEVPPPHPPVSVVFCCSTDGKHREAKECFIKLFIVDNCTISLIIRTIVNISAVYSEMDFIILCALKRDFGIFIKENSGVLMPLPPKMILAFPYLAWLLLQPPPPHTHTHTLSLHH